MLVFMATNKLPLTVRAFIPGCHRCPNVVTNDDLNMPVTGSKQFALHRWNDIPAHIYFSFTVQRFRM